jgi:S1-C subfamily serine protease
VPAAREASSLVSPAVAGVVSALAVSGVLLATGAIGDDDGGDRASPRPASSTPLSDIYDRARRGVVLVEARRPGTPQPSGPPRRGDGIATGSGFVIDDEGHVVTNDHVVAGRSQVSVGFNRRDEEDAKVVGRDPSTDLALVRVGRDKADDFRPIPLGDSSALRVGDAAIAIGNPFGLERTLTAGVVSATDREIDAPNGAPIDGAVQTDAAINSGNSGGPLLDESGAVIGVNSQSRGDGLSFAVPVDTVKKVVTDLRRHGRVRRAYLGVSTTDARRGARVAQVTPRGPADDAGVRDGDVIVELGGRAVHSPNDLARAIARRSPGDAVEVVVERGGRRVTARAELAERPRNR